jgi:hypothetical protein
VQVNCRADQHFRILRLHERRPHLHRHG